MNSTDWIKIKKIYNDALDLPSAERADFLARAEEPFRSEAEKLLHNEEKAISFIPESAFVDVETTANGDEDFYVGKQIGVYRILNVIGRGGMGTVYLAIRADGSFEKKVAIKLIKRGMDTSSVLKRFVMERNILASLAHPNIATLLDGGSTEDNLPYFVMEYIDGLSITKYCDERALDVNERLKIFSKVCEGISYAHQNLVVHSDIKPSNILVTADGTPKLLDFGIARLLIPDRSPDSADVTATAIRSMTPEYASPEQLQGLSISTASDIYSLGVVLYELLSGQRPLNIEGRLPDEVARINQIEEPIKPSAVAHYRFQTANSVSSHRTRKSSDVSTAEPREHFSAAIRNPKMLRGDLDNIVLKALKREPERRYQTVQEMSEDIRRHLAGFPVSATADTAFYRIGKFYQRHRLGVFAGVFMFLSLVGGFSVAVWQAVEARTQRLKAERRFDDVRRLTNSFLFKFENEIKDLQGATPARELTVSTALEYLELLAEENGGNSSLQFELASAFSRIADIQGAPGRSNLGNTAGAIASYQRALGIFETLLQNDPDNPGFQRALADTHKSVAYIYEVTGDPELVLKNNGSAILLYEKLIESDNDPILKLQLAECFKSLGDAVASTGNLENALELYRKSLESGEAVVASDAGNRAGKNLIMVACDAIGTTLGNPNFTNLGDTAGALQFHRRQLEIVEEMLAADGGSQFLRATKAHTLKVMGEVQTARKDWGSAAASFRSALEIQEDLVERDEKDAFARSRLAFLLTNLGEAQANLNQFNDAIINHNRAIEILSKLSAADRENGFLIQYLNRSFQKKADTLTSAGRPKEALEFYQRSLKSDEEIAAETPDNMDIRPQLVNDYLQLARLYVILSKHSRPTDNALLTEARQRFEQSKNVLLDMQRHNLRTKPIEELLGIIAKEIADIEG